jgi:hypothetical protein
VDSKDFSGQVKSRAILYGGPESSVGREDDFDVTVTLTVDLAKV